MKYLLSFIILFVPFVSAAQVRIQNDSLFVNDVPVAIYGIENLAGSDLNIEVILLGQNILFDDKAKFESLVIEDIASKPYIVANRISFRYRMQGESQLESQLRSTMIEAGGLIEDAGRSYNAALTLMGLSPAVGLLLTFAGIPALGVGAVVAIVSITASIIHVSGNKSLIKGGKKLKEQ
jgi:hypothetical protein